MPRPSREPKDIQATAATNRHRRGLVANGAIGLTSEAGEVTKSGRVLPRSLGMRLDDRSLALLPAVPQLEQVASELAGVVGAEILRVSLERGASKDGCHCSPHSTMASKSWQSMVHS